MNLTLTKRRKWIIAGVVILGTATPSFALFGVGDIVFDPSSYGQLVSQLSTLAKMLTTAQSQYNTLKSNVQNFSAKTIWQTELNKIKSVAVPNTYGETNGFTNALNLNNQSAALMAWTNSKIGLAPETSSILSTQTVGNSANLTQFAMIEASDTASPDCLNAVGSYRQARNDAATAPILGASQPDQLDASLAAVDFRLDDDLAARLDELTHDYRMGDAPR